MCRLLFCAVTGVLVGLVACSPPSPPVWTDGDFGDWDGVAPLVVDPAGDVPAGSPVDLRAIAAQDDPRFLHFLIDLRIRDGAGMPVR